MSLIGTLIDVLLHLDRHLSDVIQQYGVWTYLILFLIVFCETGLVVTPFLPGDSLLFAVGALSAMPGSPIGAQSVGLLHHFLRMRPRAKEGEVGRDAEFGEGGHGAPPSTK